MTAVKNFTSKLHTPATSMLIRAVMTNRPNLAKTAIVLGARVNVRGRDNDTLLHVCKSTEIARILLRNGAKINALNDYQQTPLHTSMRSSMKGLTRLLIESGALVNAQEEDGTTPLHLAQSLFINDALLSRGADPNIQNKNGDTPLHLAVRFKGTPIIMPLIQYGANKYIVNNAGRDSTYEFNLRKKRVEGELRNMQKALDSPLVLCGTEPASATVSTAGLLQQTQEASKYIKQKFKDSVHQLPLFNGKNERKPQQTENKTRKSFSH